MKARAKAPARVNLLGGHTDYNGGFVLPSVLPYYTVVEAEPREGVSAYSDAFAEERVYQQRAPDGSWLDYLVGVVWALAQAGYQIPGAHFNVSGNVPLGVGLSSSAALQVAALRALRRLYRLPIDDLEIAMLAQRAEAEYVGVRCGVMDQMASSLAKAGEALFIDTRSLSFRRLRLFEGARIVVVDSARPRRLAESGYNQRRAECAEAARLLGAELLREVAEPADLALLPEPYRRRARHVISENVRVIKALRALEAADADEFGRLMLASHRSLKQDFEVSTPELDRLVELALAAGAYGARLTGAGFGGAIVALVPEKGLELFYGEVSRGYPEARFY